MKLLVLKSVVTYGEVSKVLEDCCSAPICPHITLLVADFAVVVLMGGAAEQPASGPELQDFQQQQTGHGGEALLKQEAVPQQEEELVHPLAIHLLQLLSDAMKLQHQTVHLLLIHESIWLGEPHQTVKHWMDQGHHRHVVHFEVVEDVTDERDVAHPLLQRAAPGLLAVLELLLEPVQQVPPEHVPIALLGFGLHNGVADASGLFAEHLVFERLIHDDVGHLLQVDRARVFKGRFQQHLRVQVKGLDPVVLSRVVHSWW